MSAHDQMRAMLDQLMGTSRNGEDTRYRLKFSDPKVCKSFLLTCCPHEILSSTRMDLGECPKVHDLALRADYEQASAQKDYFYDIDAMEHLQSFITDCDRRTESAKKRLAETQEELSAEVAAKANKVHDLAEQIGKKLAKAEGLGADGMVEESMKLMEEVEDLRKRKAAAEQEYRNSMPASSYQQQKLRVCEVCSAYLGIHDNDRRLADHFGGKLHLGFIKIREKLEELKKTVESRREKRREERELERNARFGEIADYDVTRDHDRDRERYRETDRDRRERYREGERERRRRRSRSRTRSRERRRRRSRSRERYYRSHSRSRSRDRRRRSRSKERSRRTRRSRSRDRHTRSRDRSPSRERASKDRTSKDRASKDRTSKDRASKDRTSKDRASKERASKDRTSKDRASKDRTSKDRASKDRASKERTSRETEDRKPQDHVQAEVPERRNGSPENGEITDDRSRDGMEEN